MERPIGIAERFAAEKDEISLALSNNGIGLDGVSDEADGGSGNGGLATDSGGKLDLVSGSGGNLGVGNLAAGGDIDQIGAMLAEELRELDGFVDGPAAGNPIGGGDADKERQMSWPLGANGVHHLQGETSAILKAAAVGVSALIGERRKKLMEQVAVRRVNFNDVEAGFERAAGGRGEGVDDGVDAGLIERLRQGVAVREGQWAGRDGLPCALGGGERASSSGGNSCAGFASGVGQLNGGAGAL